MRPVLLTLAASFFLSLVVRTVGAETIYRCDDNGVLTFSDTPCRGTSLGADTFGTPRDSPESTGNVSVPSAGDNEAERIFKKCRNGDREACRRLNIANPGDTWREVSRSNRNVVSGGQLSGKYARYPVETRVTIECFPSRRQKTVYLRKDLGTVFLRDGDMVASPENNYRPARQYGSRFRTIEEAAVAVCGRDDKVDRQ